MLREYPRKSPFVAFSGLKSICGTLVALGFTSGPAFAHQFQLGPVDLNLQVSLSSGASWRVEDRSNRFVGKTNINGQQNLCQPDDCLSFSGDPAPNLRLVNAQGAFFGTNIDNGNLNYDQWDVVYATTRLLPKVTAAWGAWSIKATGLAYYDWANVEFDESHPNTLFQPATTPRPNAYEDEMALGFKSRELLLSGAFEIGDQDWALAVGDQLIRWGEANTLQFGTLSAINPLDATVFRMPGAQLAELPVPVSSAVLSTTMANGLSLDLVWMLDWKPFVIDPPGTFMSTSDIAGGGRYAIIGLGQFSEDPDGEFSLAFPASLATSTSTRAEVLPENYGYPRGGDEYGFRLGYFADWLNDGTEIGLHYLRYHSRLPIASVIATDNSCARDSPDIVSAMTVCMGGTGILDPLVPGEGREILPIATKKIFLEYPKDIDMAGLSFNTNVGEWALAGEVAYHFNLPLQVHIVDVVFAGLQPAFPRQDIHLGIDTLTDLLAQVPLVGEPLTQVTGLLSDITAGIVPQLTVPSATNAVPSFLSVYRGIDVQGNEVIHGYERRDMLQVVLSGLKAYRENPIGADQVLFLLEGAVMHVIDLPSLDQLQFEGTGDSTHASPGADGTGSGGEPDARRVNPTQQTRGFATATSWGYRSLLRASYSQVFGEYTMHPTLLWFHDIDGISPSTYQNFVEGRKQVWFYVDVELTQKLRFQTSYQAYFGASGLNLIADRDTVGLSLTYDF